MRSPVSPEKVRLLLERLGARSKGPGCIYLTGGATALLIGWRTSTLAIDIKLDPEPPGVFEAIRDLKNELHLNIELAAPDQFLPALPDWREHSLSIGRYGKVDFFHYDLRLQALSKLARGHDRDLDDVRAMLDRDLVSESDLRAALDAIKGDLLRFPALDATAFERRVRTSWRMTMTDLQDFPFGDRVSQGLSDLCSGRLTRDAMLVAMATRRLRRLGILDASPESLPEHPEVELYALLCQEEEDPYFSYSSLRRGLDSFLAAYESLRLLEEET